MAYNLTELTTGANFVEWTLIINSWTGGMMFTAFVIMGSLVTYLIAYRASGERTGEAIITMSFFWMLISALLSTIQFDSYVGLVPTFVPIMYGIMLGVASYIHVQQR